MIYYAVIDTNILVSALLTSNDDAATVQILKRIFDGTIIPNRDYIVTPREMLNIINKATHQ